MQRRDDGLVYDVGFCDGQDTAYYLHRGFRVVAVEANPLMAEQGRKSFAREIADGRLVIEGVALDHEERDGVFYVCRENPHWSSFDRSCASRDGLVPLEVPVRCRRLRSIMRERGVPHYLKVDIELRDDVVRDVGEFPEPPLYVSVETFTPELLADLESVGYTSFAAISQIDHIPLTFPYSRLARRVARLHRIERWIRRSLPVHLGLLGLTDRLRARLTRSCRSDGSWYFPRGSSGTFGDRLQGPWFTRGELLQLMENLEQRRRVEPVSAYWNEKPYSFWYDIHARHRSAPVAAAGRA
jgi:FkbM family methyltransferase